MAKSVLCVLHTSTLDLILHLHCLVYCQFVIFTGIEHVCTPFARKTFLYFCINILATWTSANTTQQVKSMWLIRFAVHLPRTYFRRHIIRNQHWNVHSYSKSGVPIPPTQTVEAAVFIYIIMIFGRISEAHIVHDVDIHPERERFEAKVFVAWTCGQVAVFSNSQQTWTNHVGWQFVCVRRNNESENLTQESCWYAVAVLSIRVLYVWSGEN